MTKFVIPGKIKGLIFDCDGTIADTMPLHYQAYEQALGENAKFFTQQMFYDLAGVPAARVMGLLKDRYNLNIDPEKVAENKERIYGENLHSVSAISPVEDVIREYHGKLPMAVASGGTRDNIERTLKLVGLASFLEIIVSADDVTHGKPAPDIFLEAAARMGVSPENCMVFEDGEKGIDAARAAGMAWIDVTK